MAYSKFNAKPTIVDGIRFPSKAEARRYSELKSLEQAGIITNLKRQPRYDICINGKLCFFYKADFSYSQQGAQVVEDVKGVRTDVYAIKKKCVEAAYGITIQEIGIQNKRSSKRDVSQEVKEIFRDAARRK